MLNPYAFYFLWQSAKGKNYLKNLLNEYLNCNKEYELLDFFNDNFNDVRSYVIFETDNMIVLVDFNLNKRVIDDDLAIIEVLECSTKKRIKFILFNNFKGQNSFEGNIYNVFLNDSFLFASSYDKQIETFKELALELYKMDDYYLKLYNHENELMMKLDT
jgi:hypothetical protein